MPLKNVAAGVSPLQIQLLNNDQAAIQRCTLANTMIRLTPDATQKMWQPA
jgi:hypothetical protein